MMLIWVSSMAMIPTPETPRGICLRHRLICQFILVEGFKQKFGPAAGAAIRFMGPVDGGIAYQEESTGGEAERTDEGSWQDANLVQYDSIWHYAHMLSTDVYQELNQQKMEGLEDTCILCVSEVEFV